MSNGLSRAGSLVCAIVAAVGWVAVCTVARGGGVAGPTRQTEATPRLTPTPLVSRPLFRRATDSAGAVILEWNRATVDEARREGRRFSVNAVPVSDAETVDLDLEPFRVTGPATRFVVGSVSGPDRPVDFDPSTVAMFRGRVAGNPGSSVFLALSDQIVTGHIHLGAGAASYRLAPAAASGGVAAPNRAVVHRSRAASSLPAGIPKCGVEAPADSLPAPGGVAGTAPLRLDTQHIQVAVETDYELFSHFGNLAGAAAYVTALYGEVSSIYMRDVNAWIELSFVRLWDNPADLFNQTDPLDAFRNYWQTNMGAVVRDTAQFCSGRTNMPYGGVAYVEALCTTFAYSVVGYIKGSFPDPAHPSIESYDVGVVAHELGHNCGTYHTHDYGVDTCNNFNAAPQRGTIMSYCSQTYSGGASNDDEYFHSVTVDAMVAHVHTAACVADDCNRNGVPDSSDISGGFSADTNSNLVPDECEDCNANGRLDFIDLFMGSSDVNSNGIPDECEPDCNGNGIPDTADIQNLTSTDAHGNMVPDECEADCNGNAISDYTEIQDDMSLDLNRDAVLDSCQDCDFDGTKDLAELDGAYHVWAASETVGNALREFHAVVGTVTRLSDPGHVDLGQDLIITPDARILVTSSSDDRVAEFDRSGAFVGDLVPSGSGGLDYPTGLVVGANGNVFVCSRDSNSVLQYDLSSGAFVGAFVLAGSGGLVGPFGLAFGPNGNLFVTSADNRVLEYDGVTGAFVREFVSTGSGGLSGPRSILFKPTNGNLLVASTNSNQVLEYNGVTGAFIGQFNKGGTATALTMDQPWGMRIGPNGHVFVVRHDETLSSDEHGNDDDTRIGDEGSNISHLHLNATRIYMFHVDTGNFLRSYVTGNDTGMVRTTGFDFMPGCPTDSNANQVPDQCELATCTIPDCNSNTVADSCDISMGTSTDADSSGRPDECEASCLVATAPAAATTMPDAGFGRTNRYLAFAAGGCGAPLQAVRVTFVSLPGPFSALNGESMWVGPVQLISENAGVRDPLGAPGFPTFSAATLQCAPHYADWGLAGPTYVYHPAVVPNGRYRFEAISDFCDVGDPASYSAALLMNTSRWGDAVEDCATTPCPPPDGSVDVVTDVVAVLDKFANRPGAPIKARVDFEPGPADGVINISDVTSALDGFRGLTYPFPPPAGCP